MKKYAKIYKIIPLGFLGLLLIFFCFCFWLYSGLLTPLKTKILNSLLFPVAIANGRLVSMSQFTFRYEIAKKNTPGQTDSWLRAQAYSALIEETRTAEIAAKYGISVGKNELDIELNRQINQSNSNFRELLQKYGVSESGYKNQILKPQLLLVDLKIWYNGQNGLSAQNYNLAQNILSSIRAGGNIENLAASLSQNENGKALSGDMGFVDIADILPELKEPLANMELGEVKLIPSRFGLHIIKVESRAGNKVHLREIFLKGVGFDSWHNLEAEKIKIKNFIKI